MEEQSEKWWRAEEPQQQETVMHTAIPQQQQQQRTRRFARKLHLRLKTYTPQVYAAVQSDVTSSSPPMSDVICSPPGSDVTCSPASSPPMSDVTSSSPGSDVISTAESSDSGEGDVYYDFDLEETYVVNGGDGLGTEQCGGESLSPPPPTTNGHLSPPPDPSLALPPSSFKISRSSSLKTGKTPPSTPARKKIVRFADVLGLDLTDVRTFLDEIPRVPLSAFSDLDAAISCSSSGRATSLSLQKPIAQLLPNFHQPFSQPDFLDRIRENGVCLENAYQTGDRIAGTVRVKNIDYHKSVYVRYTLDDWRSWIDFQATYSPGSCDGFSDKFEFQMALPNLEIGSRLQFCVRFHCKGAQYWDSNGGKNYAFAAVPSCAASNSGYWSEMGGGWM